jgi:phospholipid/cholesterol/gamma-HCH transport system ATP-binding protein
MENENEKPIIEVRNLTKSFGTQKVLKGIDLLVFPGEIMVIMGGSGCGKSTLLRHMIGLITPDQGSIKMFGKELTEIPDDQLDQIRQRFGILFQSGALINSLSIYDNVALPLREHTKLDESTIEIMVKIKLELVGLREHAAKMPAQLSGGMKKRAGLARAVALDPEILFYDEPDSGLDPVTSAQIDQLIIDLNRKLDVTSVVVTHHMETAFAIADRMCMLDKGVILKLGPKPDFEKLRNAAPHDLTDVRDKIIRQFLRGDAQGPLARRKLESSYEEDLLRMSNA